MPTPKCPKCKQVIPSDDINVVKDIAYCRTCNLTHQLTSIVKVSELESGVDLTHPPDGVWRREEGSETVIGSTHRSLGTAFTALGICLFWNGVVSIFVLPNIAATLHNLNIPVPIWFPAPDMNGDSKSVGSTIFIWVFLAPFILVGTVMVGVFLSVVAGRTEVRISGTQGDVFTGSGRTGWHRRFDVTNVSNVRIDNQTCRDSDGDRQSRTLILLETRDGKTIKFGTLLSGERRKFVAAAVHQAVMR